MNVCIISGSPRKAANSHKIAKCLKAYLNQLPGVEALVVSFEHYDIPLMAQGRVSADNLSPFQQELRDGMAAAQLVILISPEYNWMPSAELVNLIHQMTERPFEAMWRNKAFAMVGCSNGRGGKFPTVQLTYVLNKIISVMSYDSIVVPRVFESQFTQKALDENGNSLGNEEYDKGLQLFADTAFQVAMRWAGA